VGTVSIKSEVGLDDLEVSSNLEILWFYGSQPVSKDSCLVLKCEFPFWYVTILVFRFPVLSRVPQTPVFWEGLYSPYLIWESRFCASRVNGVRHLEIIADCGCCQLPRKLRPCKDLLLFHLPFHLLSGYYSILHLWWEVLKKTNKHYILMLTTLVFSFSRSASSWQGRKMTFSLSFLWS